ncbi:adenylate isopentenyltransferase 3, chloroplastic-like [Apium graveolens]|uniref:adenylate isopentenyltransferase 3, chloroplastic-like n=1 Tax=Apium graveolens TaxID=4045 RepID=UPI003D797992
MRMSMLTCKQITPSLNIPDSRHVLPFLRSFRQPKEKVLVVMGATGTGKSKLSIDLATRFSGEVVNSDKMQAYEGLDIITNKITEEEACDIPHHLLGIIDPNVDFTSSNFCSMASLAIRSIAGRRQLPIIVGGSNSFIEALVDDEIHEFRSRYECCFLWVDVSMPVLHRYISERVDRMVENGMVDEARRMFSLDADYSKGITKAIGFPEFDQYFRLEPYIDVETRARLCQKAIDEVKNNTCKLACRQLEKIYRLRNNKGWKVHRLDATDAFLKHGKESDRAWDEFVAEPSMVIVSRFLNSFGPNIYMNPTIVRGEAMETAMVTATH